MHLPSLWLRGILPLSVSGLDRVQPAPEAPVALSVGTCELADWGNGDFYVDGGGGPHSKDPRVRRCAWAVVAF
eukprot:10581520-Lingulodinium_polyedra.AAC.1